MRAMTSRQSIQTPIRFGCQLVFAHPWEEAVDQHQRRGSRPARRFPPCDDVGLIDEFRLAVDGRAQENGDVDSCAERGAGSAEGG